MIYRAFKLIGTGYFVGQVWCGGWMNGEWINVTEIYDKEKDAKKAIEMHRKMTARKP